jgi:hypothetical protein
VDRRNEKIMTENLDLAPGYSVECEGSAVYLVDPKGRRVAQLPPVLAPGYRDDAGNLVEPSRGWRELCLVLLERIYQQDLENEALGKRVEQLEERLAEAEDERDQANAIAENLYQNFRDHIRRVRRRKQPSVRERLR